MNLTQRQLKLFVTTAASGNISRASEQLHLSQPALSRAIQEFESQLGTPLFHRTTRKLALSEAGVRFLPTAQRLLHDLEHAAAEVREGAEGLSGTVVVAVGTAFACTVLPSVIERFVRIHPRVRIRLRTDNSEGITTRVTSTEADIGIGSPVGDTASVQCTSLLVAPLGLLGDPKRFRLRGRIDTDLLSTLPLLKESEATSIMQILRAQGSLLVPAMRNGVEVSCLASQLALAQAGVGVAVWSALGASHPQAQGLQFVALAPRMTREIFAIQRVDRRPNPSAEALLHAVKHGMAAVRLHKSVKKRSPSG